MVSNTPFIRWIIIYWLMGLQVIFLLSVWLLHTYIDFFIFLRAASCEMHTVSYFVSYGIELYKKTLFYD